MWVLFSRSRLSPLSNSVFQLRLPPSSFLLPILSPCPFMYISPRSLFPVAWGKGNQEQFVWNRFLRPAGAAQGAGSSQQLPSSALTQCSSLESRTKVIFSCCSRPPPGGTRQVWLRVEGYPRALRDHSLRSWSLSKTVIKRSVTTAQCMDSKEGFLLLDRLICGVFLHTFEKVLVRALNQGK